LLPPNTEGDYDGTRCSRDGFCAQLKLPTVATATGYCLLEHHRKQQPHCMQLSANSCHIRPQRHHHQRALVWRRHHHGPTAHGLSGKLHATAEAQHGRHWLHRTTAVNVGVTHSPRSPRRSPQRLAQGSSSSSFFIFSVSSSCAACTTACRQHDLRRCARCKSWRGG
jgi:hypothetical protein